MNTTSSSEKRVVPWFSMGEWRNVYESLYSDDQDTKKRGYERLLGWKARIPKLPTGVECTLGILQVIIEDESASSSGPLHEQNLRLIYSTAVMRFLNLMLEVSDEENSGASMYSKAGKQNIPEWLVNLRHGAAHGTSLPELSLLRAAAQFILKWLNENYWLIEGEAVSDWVVTTEDVTASFAPDEKLQRIVETWETLSVYKLTGFSSIHQIPDPELKSNLDAIREVLRGDETSRHHVNTVQVSIALRLVLKSLTRFMKNRSGPVDKRSLLAEMLVQGDSLLPSKDILNVIDPNNKDKIENYSSLPLALIELWSDMMQTLWELEVIPILVRKLIDVSAESEEGDGRRRVAALWVQMLLLSCIKVREARKVRSALLASDNVSTVCQMYTDPNIDYSRKELLYAVALSAVENQRADLKQAYTWQFQQIPQSLSSSDLLHRALFPLSEHASFMLPSIMELAVPPLPLNIRDRLLELVSIYNRGNLHIAHLNGTVPYTVNDLFESMGQCMEISTEKDLPKDLEGTSDAVPLFNPSNFRWSHSQEHLKWGQCPLGLLPWQREEQHNDQIQFEQRQRLRSWSRLILPGQWEEENCTDEETDLDTVKPKRKERLSQHGGIRKKSRKSVLKKLPHGLIKKAMKKISSTK